MTGTKAKFENSGDVALSETAPVPFGCSGGCRPHNMGQLRDAGARIGRGVTIHPSATIDNPEKLVLGDEVKIGPGVRLLAAGGITIGARTIIEPGVQVLSSTPRIPTDGKRIMENGLRIEKVHIGEDALLGANAVVMPGTHIGEGAVAGPNCLAQNNIVHYKVVGVPEPIYKANRMGAMYAE